MRHKTMNGLLALALAVPAAAAGQEREDLLSMTESAAAAALMADRDSPDIWRAIGLAVDLGPRAGQELRAAVIDAAWAEVRREAAARAGVGPAGGDPDRLFLLFEAAEAFRDPRAIPLMVEALKYGGGVMDALADLGAAAFPATLAAVSDPGGHPHRVSGGVTVLRFMVEDGVLNGRQLEQVRDAARERLSGTQDPFILRAAVRLALALGETELRRTVERIAADRVFAEALVLDAFPLIPGSHAEDTDNVQEYARLFLSGGGAGIGPIRKRQ
ncbi:hypothetical protein [Candidatus Palauibacter sp.]|uniref:hypothetical protein n=1 Tax=Candidatus Palauibacter sp. TaxID=3101350 RepID=UPI003B53010F